MAETLFGMVLGFVATAIGLPVFFTLLKMLGFYTVVEERTCRVYVLFGSVVAELREPGLNFLWPKLGWRALIVHWVGRVHVVDLRLDQQYLRSLAVNSEEGAPMGIGVWYEMYVSDPVRFLFENADPRGSLAANVSNATVRSLSNMKLSDMLESRHTMSRTVRAEVSPQSHAWGYKLGSVYIRKVHFRDTEMIRQIEEKVVNRLRQVTSAIRQDGANQVSIITSTADRQAAVEFAKAAALRPQIVGAALRRIGEDPEVLNVMFEVLELQRLMASNAAVTLVPQEPTGGGLIGQLLAARGVPEPVKGR
ncbi:SPFH/Band 7/PHB domain protein [Aggregicoccus sp. 17bor-14]|uniref:SPFH domain-containing protein n=1 Tax=Myxococcaceae TaxID=31 RepID=UPI00129C4CA4|nr:MULTISPECIES: SPFH domain-containing protein [Myxococcaceae]MBF5042095.1 SPFH/Band 7/PHB domain protein [Simulacricoccus sp. 17bor-14]MRI87873.1 SPFH/Band 7/PHB domain protein [Aggregicoccus sp. 17bor-14]